MFYYFLKKYISTETNKESFKSIRGVPCALNNVSTATDYNFKATELKPRPNDRNMPTQHVATLLGATCCVRLATVSRCVATWKVLLAQI